MEVVLHELAAGGRADHAEIDLQGIEPDRLVGAGLGVVPLVGVLQQKARVEPGGVGPVVVDRLRGEDIVRRVEVLAERNAEPPRNRRRRALAEEGRQSDEIGHAVRQLGQCRR